MLNVADCVRPLCAAAADELALRRAAFLTNGNARELRRYATSEACLVGPGLAHLGSWQLRLACVAPGRFVAAGLLLSLIMLPQPAAPPSTCCSPLQPEPAAALFAEEDAIGLSRGYKAEAAVRREAELAAV